jgi:dipeptidyl aminopeptidase/acylaminoacyl peptidase
MWDDEADAAIDQVAQELTTPLGPGDLPAQVLTRLDHPEVRRQVSWWAVAAPVAALVVAGGIALGVFRSSGHQRAQPSTRQTPASEPQVLAARSLVWVDRQGREEPLMAPSRGYLSVRLSPDGRQIALGIRDGVNENIWLMDLARGTLTRVTTFAGLNGSPVWSPDARRIVFHSDRKGTTSFDLYERLLNGAEGEQALLISPRPKTPLAWSPDGRLLLYQERDPSTGLGLWGLPLDGDRKPVPVLLTPFDEGEGQFSPDGRWLAYQSNESGRKEIYVRPFAFVGGKWQISTAGGAVARWGRNGRELFYINNGKMMAVDITTQPGFLAGESRMLFEGPYADNFDVAPDSQRLLMIKAR